MVYLEWFRFPDADQEWDFFMKPELKRTCYDSYYPFQVLAGRLEWLEFEPVTILYGGNGSGKTTALNVMAAALGLERDSPYNQSNFFPDYVEMCEYELTRGWLQPGHHQRRRVRLYAGPAGAEPGH